MIWVILATLYLLLVCVVVIAPCMLSSRLTREEEARGDA